MKQEIKRKWVEALRSGKYSQDKECALVVLILLISLKRASSSDGLTAEAWKKIVNINDGINGEKKHNFEEIAEYVEKNL